MSDPATYAFVPWARRGLAALASKQTQQNFLTLQVGSTVNATPTAPLTVRLHGPGQVTGIDPRAIVRVEPRPSTQTFEPNYLAAVEFATPDFPWLFTPALPSGDALRPWLCLAVVREQPGVQLISRPDRLPLLQFATPAVPLDELPNLDQIAMWAHVQLVGGDTVDATAVRSALTGPPATRLSRILCPRKLEPNTSYLACLVPTFRAGSRIGVAPELPVEDGDRAPAWDSSTRAPFTLPVYYSWRFSTGQEGDFASLVSQLRPPAGPLQVGLRMLDVSAPGFGMPEFPGLQLGLEGALRARETQPTPWPDGVQAQFEQHLRGILNPPPGPDPIVTPPVYGQVPAGHGLPDPSTPPNWLAQLNLDPRNRVAAGIGARVVQADQEALVASAWDQFEAVRRANQQLRQLQLARSVSRSILTRHLARLEGPGALLQITRPLHTRLRLDASSPTTLAAHVGQSRIPDGIVSATFRRLARPNGPVARRLYAGVAAAASSRMVERFNAAPGQSAGLALVGARVPPAGTITLDTVSPNTPSSSLAPAAVSPSAVSTTISAEAPGGGIAHGAPVEAGHIGPIGEGGGETQARFRAAAAVVTRYTSQRLAAFADPPERPPLAATLNAVQSLMLSTLDPDTTLVAHAAAQFTLPARGDPLRPLVTAPDFPQPMSRTLRPQQLLPGVERLPLEPPALAALLVTNERFVEAFMLGLNDELRRELVWRQYPLDATATFFRTFWDRSAAGAPDIPPVASWSPTSQLGANATAQPVQDPVVLLLRGELLRRYPSATISAVQASVIGGVRQPGTVELMPLFRGEIEPNMVFFGFPLGARDATTGDGWYFVIAEHPTEPRFGLEPQAAPHATPATWNDLAWNQVALDQHHNLDVSHPPSASPPDTSAAWGVNSAQQAYITLRRPVRVAMHATALFGGLV